jgi:hypothetical protein
MGNWQQAMDNKQYANNKLELFVTDMACFILPVAYCLLPIVLDQYELFDLFDLIFGYGQISPKKSI